MTTPQEDIDLFARWMYSRRGPTARHDAIERAHQLKRLHDDEGYTVWLRLAEAVERLSKSARRAVH